MMSKRTINLNDALNIRKQSNENDQNVPNQIFLMDDKIDFDNIDYSNDNYILPPQSKKSDMIWSTKQPKMYKMLKKDKMRVPPGLTSYSKGVCSFLDTFKLFINDQI